MKDQNNPYIAAGKVAGGLLCGILGVCLSAAAYSAGIPWVAGGDSWGFGHAMAGFAGLVMGLILTIITAPILFSIKRLQTELKYIGTLFTAPILVFLFAFTTSSINTIKEHNKYEALKRKTEATIANPQDLKALIEKAKTESLSADEKSIIASAILNKNTVIQEEMPFLLQYYKLPDDPSSSAHALELSQLIKHQKLTDDQFRKIYASSRVSPGGSWWGICMDLLSNPDTPVDILQDLVKQYPESSMNHDIGEKAVAVLKTRNAPIDSTDDWHLVYSQFISDAYTSSTSLPPLNRNNPVSAAIDDCLNELRTHPEVVTSDEFWKSEENILTTKYRLTERQYKNYDISESALMWFLPDPKLTISKVMKDYILTNFPNCFTPLLNKKLLTKGDLESVVLNKRTSWELASVAQENIKKGNYIQDSEEAKIFSQSEQSNPVSTNK